MRITLGDDSINVNRRISRAWFPQLPHTPWLDGNMLVDNLDSHIDNRYGIKRHNIEHALQWFIEKLGHYSGSSEEQTQMHIVDALMALMKTDVRNSWQAKGLRGSRHIFIVLAYLALDCQSALLAEALHYFWLQGMQYIMQTESPKYQGDWHKAREKIRELMEGPTTTDLGALAMIPYAGLHRGRSPRALALPWLGHRARSLPAIRCRHNPDMRLAIPAYPSSAWTSPMISPIGYPRNDYFEELDNLQYQQSEMSLKLENVDGKLDLLLASFYS